MTTAIMEQDLIGAAMAFPIPTVLSRYANEQNLEKGVVELHERELKRYLIICALYPNGGWPMTATIDELWHTFIIFTNEYHEFCRRLNRPYIHHRPDTGSEDMTKRTRAFKLFHELYQHHFGSEPPETIWPTRNASSCRAHCKVRDCMTCGHCDDPKPQEPTPHHCWARDCMTCGHCR